MQRPSASLKAMETTKRVSSKFMLILCFLSLPYLSSSLERSRSTLGVRRYTEITLTSGIGPESLAFDCDGEGPYTGVSDGRILKWRGADAGWTDFAFTSPNRSSQMCDGSSNRMLEGMCGRPLGIKFNLATCELYIADAYYGLLVVGPKGGVAEPLATGVGGVPFQFTNAVDFDNVTGVIYFTDTSASYQRWDFETVILAGDRTGRLLKYDPKTKEVTVLLQGLAFANGVALSRDNAFVLVAETGARRVLRLWLRGPKQNTSEVFAHLNGLPDNIKRNDAGEFWVAQTLPMLGERVAPVKLDEQGKILDALDINMDNEVGFASEVLEHLGKLWIGSVTCSYVAVLA